MPNINFKGGTEEFDVTAKPHDNEPAPEPEWARALREEREAMAQQLAQQQAHTNRKMSELYEQAAMQNRTFLEYMKKQAPEPDYSSNDAYFQDSYNTKDEPKLTPEEIRQLAKEAAEETFRTTVQRGTEVQNYRAQREKELREFFEEKCTDLHPYQNKVYGLYQQAQQNFPQATPDQQFEWALQVSRSFVADLEQGKKQQQRPSPVGRHGNYPREAQAHREMHVEDSRSDKDILSDYYHEISEFENELNEVFDN